MAAIDPRPARGRPAGATRDEVLARATTDWLACRRIDVQAIAVACGVGRATVYRWFGSRELLIGEAMLQVVQRRVADARAAAGGSGPEALLDTLDRIYRGLSAAPHIHAFLEQDHATALSVMTAGSGIVHPRMVALVRGLVDDEVARGTWRPPVDPGAVAYVVVRLGEGMLFHDADNDTAVELDRLRGVCAALLGAGVR